MLYRNGEYWGVYELREKVDDLDFTSYYYDQDEPNVEFLQTWGSTWAPYGVNAQNNWNTFLAWVNANNLNVPANYNYIDSVYNIESLTDYFILNSFTVCQDWLNWNTAWWRGLDPAGKKKKWRYTLWDMDATFGHYINYTGVPNTGPSADPCDPNTLNDPGGQGHVPILNKLMQTDTFKVYYINRYVDLVNTVFNCNNMHQVLDSMIAAIDPEMDAQCTKWGGTKSGWQASVNTLSNFIDDRCVQLINGFINCYDLKGPYEVQINAIPKAGGVVKFNSLFIDDYVWTGKYFGNIKQYLAPIPNPGYHFTHWSIEGDTLFPSNNDSLVFLNIDTNIKVIAHFEFEDTTTTKNEIFVPTAFSPNGDGENDVFKVYGDSIETVTMEVYNRWGEKVFSSNNKNEGWRGTYKDQLLNSDVFTFRVEVVMENKKRISKKGSITLMR
ncbi:MAG: CotH kinase family protein [Bacteroidetes bacterium]|nr:CotH kinase family protein [Bacteroidota bacterium]